MLQNPNSNLTPHEAYAQVKMKMREMIQNKREREELIEECVRRVMERISIELQTQEAKKEIEDLWKTINEMFSDLYKGGFQK